MMTWSRLPELERAETRMVPGDKSVMQTRWWNRWFLILFGWKTVMVFEVAEVPAGGFYVGFRNSKNEVFVRGEPVTNRRFAMLVGYEDCEFFALDMPIPGGDSLKFVRELRMERTAARKAGLKIL